MATLTPQGLFLFHEALLPDWQVGLPFFCPLGTQSSELLMALLSSGLALLQLSSSSLLGREDPFWSGFGTSVFPTHLGRLYKTPAHSPASEILITGSQG